MSGFTVSKEIQFDAGHRVPDHAGKCSNPHGHRYKVTLLVNGGLQSEGAAKGMVLDFSDIKKILQEIHDKFDHGFIVSNRDIDMLDMFGMTYSDISNDWAGPSPWKIIVVGFSPTAEELARWCYDYARIRFSEEGWPGQVLGVEVWETPTSAAFYPAL